jgi:Rrf2 family protein
MRLTRETDYALHGLAALARRADSAPVALAEIAHAENLPPSFLAKIFQKLTRHGILQSGRGAGNGYSLAVAAHELSVLRVIEAVEGSDYLDRCMFWGGRCGGEHPCLLHDRWAAVKPKFIAMLEHTTLADLVAVARSQATGESAVSGAGPTNRGG